MRKIVVDDAASFVVKEVGGDFDGLVYRKSKKCGFLMVYIPTTMDIAYTRAGSLLVNGWLVQSDLVIESKNNIYTHCDALAVHYNPTYPFFDDYVNDYCRALLA